MSQGLILVLLGSLFSASGLLVRYVSLGKCVLLGTSKAVRKSMWAVGLYEADWGGYAFSARLGSHSRCFRGWCAAFGFQDELGLVGEKYLRAGLHAVEPSLVPFVLLHNVYST